MYKFYNPVRSKQKVIKTQFAQSPFFQCFWNTFSAALYFKSRLLSYPKLLRYFVDCRRGHLPHVQCVSIGEVGGFDLTWNNEGTSKQEKN